MWRVTFAMNIDSGEKVTNYDGASEAELESSAARRT
jgi:hypothetical protein